MTQVPKTVVYNVMSMKQKCRQVNSLRKLNSDIDMSVMCGGSELMVDFNYICSHTSHTESGRRWSLLSLTTAGSWQYQENYMMHRTPNNKPDYWLYIDLTVSYWLNIQFRLSHVFPLLLHFSINQTVHISRVSYFASESEGRAVLHVDWTHAWSATVCLNHRHFFGRLEIIPNYFLTDCHTGIWKSLKLLRT